jgi:vancomycin permeability regulator SanA
MVQFSLPCRKALLISALGAIVLTSPLGAMAYLSHRTVGDRYTRPQEVPAQRPVQPVAMVFGAGVYGNQPSPMLADRVEGAVQLYRQGKVSKILMTGDNSKKNYDEVGVMKQYAIAQGVPATAITTDHAGFNTYDSCYRAKQIFGVSQAVLVTQAYHLPRAVYTCQQLGIQAMGLGTPDWERYGGGVIGPYTLREAFSSLKAIAEVHVIRPQPTFLGKFEGLK